MVVALTPTSSPNEKNDIRPFHQESGWPHITRRGANAAEAEPRSVIPVMPRRPPPPRSPTLVLPLRGAGGIPGGLAREAAGGFRLRLFELPAAEREPEITVGGRLLRVTFEDA